MKSLPLNRSLNYQPMTYHHQHHLHQVAIEKHVVFVFISNLEHILLHEQIKNKKSQLNKSPFKSKKNLHLPLIFQSKVLFQSHSFNSFNSFFLLESKRSRLGKGKRPSSPLVTMNILTTSSSPTKKKRRSSATTDASSSDMTMAKVDLPSPTYPVPLLDTRNPVTWNVNDVCSYLNQSGCSFALKTIQEQEIDGAALLLLDDLPKVQDLLEFKLGPAVKFCHVVEQLRTQVIDTFHSSPSLKTSRLSSNHSS